MIFAACHSNSSGPHNANLTGVFNAPTGSIGSALISGPSNYSTTMVGTTTLSALNPGDYSFSVKNIRIDDPIVSPLDTGFATPNPVNVVSDQTDTAIVTYNQRPGTGGAWITNGGATGTLVQYTSSQLGVGGAPTPAITLSGAPLASATDVVVDTRGNLWVLTASTDAILEYTVDQLTGATAGSPLKILVGATPGGIAFDFAGNLWVTIPGDSGQLIEYSSIDLQRVTASGATLTPVAVGRSFLPQDSLTALSFDGAGNLWIAAKHRGEVVFYPASTLTTASPYPPYSLQIGATPTIPILDLRGNLWVFTSAHTILEYSASQIPTITNTTAPAVTVTINNSAPIGAAAFDNSGTLWMAAPSAGALLTLTAQQLSAGGTQTPTTSVTGVTTPSGLAFDPRGVGVPLYGSRAPRTASTH